MKTIQELHQIRERKRKELDLRVNTKSDTREKHILVCQGTGCTSSKSPEILETFKRLIKENGIENVRVIKTGCFGLCAKGPIVIIRPEDTFYAMVKPEDCEEIIKTHIMEGNQVERLLAKDIDGTKVHSLDDLNFYKKQKRIALKNCGMIDPEQIDEYIAFDGYLALEKVVTEMSQDEVIEEIKKSGIRGRGGAGFPTGKKWELTKASEGEQKYVVCNADEGDPGAFMDRSILEGDPHSVLEAMEIAGYCIGANKGYIYVRAEYPIAVKRLQIAIDQAREYGILGKNIFDTNFDFDIEIRLGAGAFVCGEETALLESIEGKRGQPRVKPPYPATAGLWGKPTLINNVETYANIAQIILKGSEWYSSIGTEHSKGTKVFALGGNVNNIGLVEVPMGTTLREIVYDIGGGIPNGRDFKAAQTGGPSGGCIPKEHLDTPIDYESLKEIGSMMGSGGLIVMDDTKCMVSLAKFYLEFTVSESCGKCTPCRIGTKRMHEILEKLCNGEGTELDIYKLEKLAMNIQKSSICGLGQSAPNPVISTLKYFKDEFKEHAIDKNCRALECKAMSKITIREDKCKGCGLCQKSCPVNAIEGEAREKRVINQEKCIKCGTCLASCPFKAIGN
ncbi:MAG: NADH-quinone oxidoreductase subunit NuoF [Clostridia bacterium]|nr:NADH-quinone oxidoreductase subunit NuoF [Clostridia bacterium]